MSLLPAQNDSENQPPSPTDSVVTQQGSVQGANRPTTSEAARDGRAKTKAHDPQPSGRTEEFVEKSKEMYQKISGQNDRSLAEIMDSSTKAARDEINKLENVLHPAGPAVPTAQPAKITPERPLGRR